jgi:hypothetical protein
MATNPSQCLRRSGWGPFPLFNEVARLLGEPGSGRVGGDAEDMHAAGGVLGDISVVEVDGLVEPAPSPD